VQGETGRACEEMHSSVRNVIVFFGRSDCTQPRPIRVPELAPFQPRTGNNIAMIFPRSADLTCRLTRVDFPHALFSPLPLQYNSRLARMACSPWAWPTLAPAIAPSHLFSHSYHDHNMILLPGTLTLTFARVDTRPCVPAMHHSHLFIVIIACIYAIAGCWRLRDLGKIDVTRNASLTRYL